MFLTLIIFIFFKLETIMGNLGGEVIYKLINLNHGYYIT